MKVQVQFVRTTPEDAELEVDENKLLEYINSDAALYSSNPPGNRYASLDEVRDTGDFDWLLREYLEEEVFTQGALLIDIPTSSTGPVEFEIDGVQEVQ